MIKFDEIIKASDFKLALKNYGLSSYVLNLKSFQKQYSNLFQVIGNKKLYEIILFLIQIDKPFYNLEKMKKLLSYFSNPKDKRKIFSHIRRIVKKHNCYTFLKKLIIIETDKFPDFLENNFGNYTPNRIGVPTHHKKSYDRNYNKKINLKKQVLIYETKPYVKIDTSLSE